MEITYSSTRSDQWRCHLYVMFHRPQTVLTQLLTPAILTFWLTPLFRTYGILAIPLALLVSLLLSALILGLTLQALIIKRLPTPTSQRICTTSLSPELFRDITPDKTMEYLWTQITDIRLHNSDFYFWLGGTRGNFIPGSAFENPREAQLFFDTAVHYWQSAKSGQVAAGGPSQNGSWPPAPRL